MHQNDWAGFIVLASLIAVAWTLSPAPRGGSRTATQNPGVGTKEPVGWVNPEPTTPGQLPKPPLDDEALPEGVVARLGTVRFRSSSPIVDVAVSPDGTLLAVAGAAGRVTLFETATGKRYRHLIIPDRAAAPVFSHDGRFLAVISDGSACEWEVQTGAKRPIELEPVNHYIKSLAYCGSNELVGVVVEGDQFLQRRIVDIHTRKLLGRLVLNEWLDDLQLSHDATQALSSSTTRGDCSATLWDVASGTILVSRKLPGTGKIGLVFTSGGTPLAIVPHNNVFGFDNGRPKNRLRVTDVATGKTLHEVVEDRDVGFLGFSSDSELIAHSTVDLRGIQHNPACVVVRKLNTGEEVFRTNFDSEQIGHARFSAGGQIMAVDTSDAFNRARDHALAVWDLAAGKRIDSDMSGHRASVRSLVFSADGKSIASASPDGSVRLWDVIQTAESAALTDAPVNGRGIAVSPDGTLVAATAGGFYESKPSGVVVWDAQTRVPIHTLPVAYISESASVTFSNDGKYLATGARLPRGGWMIGGLEEARASGGIEVWDHEDLNRFPFRDGRDRWFDDAVPAKNFHARGALSDYSNGVSCVAISPDGEILAAVGGDRSGGGKLSLWKLPAGELIHEIARRAGRVAFSPDGEFLATSSSYNNYEVEWFEPQFEGSSRLNEIEIGDVAEGTVVKTLVGHGADVAGIAFSPDGHHLASASLDKTIGVWNVSDGRLVTSLKGHTGGVLCVAFSSDGKLLASGSTDTMILVWDFLRALSEAEKNDGTSR